MRITTQQIYSQGVNQLLLLNRQVADTQQQLSTGRRFLTPGDDPNAAVRVAALTQDLAARKQYTDNLFTVENELNLQETVLAQAVGVIQRVRELTVQGGNEVLDNTNRSSIAAEVENRLDELFSLMNTRGSNGDYLFGGFKADTLPFGRDGTGAAIYNGDEGQRKVQVSSTASIAVSDSGKRIFEDVPSTNVTVAVKAPASNDPLSNAFVSVNILDQSELDTFHPDNLVIEFEALADGPGNQPNFTVRRQSDNRVVAGLANIAYVAGADIDVTGTGLQLHAFGTPQPGDRFFIETGQKQSIATTFDKLIAGLRGNPVDTDLGVIVGATLDNLDNAIESVNQVRAEVGARLNTADSTAALHEQVKIFSDDVLSKLRDTDYAEAISRLSLQTFVLEAAQRSFLKVSQLSLFNLL